VSCQTSIIKNAIIAKLVLVHMLIKVKMALFYVVGIERRITNADTMFVSLVANKKIELKWLRAKIVVAIKEW
jgi:hypothetical protein